MYIWLVVWNIFYFSIQLGIIIIPIDELIFFRWVCSTTNQNSTVTSDVLNVELFGVKFSPLSADGTLVEDWDDP